MIHNNEVSEIKDDKNEKSDKSIDSIDNDSSNSLSDDDNAWEELKRLVGLEVEEPEKPTNNDESKLESALHDFDLLVKSSCAYQKLADLSNGYQLRLRCISNRCDLPPFHLAFANDNPDLTAYSVAREVAKIYNALGYISDENIDHILEVDREKLVAKYVGQTAPNTEEWIEKSLGGILLVNDADSLRLDDRDSFGEEAIYTIIKAIENKKEGLIVVLFGNKDKMLKFIESNLSVDRRFQAIEIIND